MNNFFLFQGGILCWQAYTEASPLLMCVNGVIPVCAHNVGVSSGNLD